MDFLKDDGSENVVKIKIRKENHKLNEDEESFFHKWLINYYYFALFLINKKKLLFEKKNGMIKHTVNQEI